MINIDRDFGVECTGDICVGDTIVITERLYARDGVQSGGSIAGSFNASIVSEARSLKESRAKMTDDDVMTLSMGELIGERTIAAHVVRDNYRTARDTVGEALMRKRFGKIRRLWLEVVWQSPSNEACKPYELRPGVVIERQQASIEKFEVFRMAWLQETSRKSLIEEHATLAECFHVYG